MTAQFPMAVQFTVRCSECGKESEPQRFRLVEGSQLPYPSFPMRWTFLAGVPRCEKHSVEVIVDGQGTAMTFEERNNSNLESMLGIAK